MGITGTIRRSEILIEGDMKWLIPKLNRLYEIESNRNRIRAYSNCGIKCDYALIHSRTIPEKNVREAIGFGICFPKGEEYECTRIIIFSDLIDAEFLDMAVAHEYAHIGKDELSDEENQIAALELELKVAELSGKKEKWIEYNRKEDPSRIRRMQRLGLLS